MTYINIPLSPEVLTLIGKYQEIKGVSSVDKAVVELLDWALDTIPYDLRGEFDRDADFEGFTEETPAPKESIPSIEDYFADFWRE